MFTPASGDAALSPSRTASQAIRDNVSYRPRAAGERRASFGDSGIPARERRQSPRRSVIIVLADDSAFSEDALPFNALSSAGDVDVTVACAGNLSVVGTLRERARDVRVLIGPAGMTGEDLREFAMGQVAGDIVTLLDGAALADSRQGLRP